MRGKTPFSRVLVANRGEIALRVMRSAHALGYRTVAVYSSADLHSPHVATADHAVCIGDALPAQSYLNVAAIIDAARATGADAVHPGYGFLAENADFAAACREADIVFIGPSPEAIRAMGDKAGAKRLMREAGVPCIPGYQGEDQNTERLAQEAGKIGYPLMIKATAGGGGRGMRLVKNANDFADLLRSAQSEAQSAFGNPTVILERAIAEPRHIEIQIFADRHGNVVHLGERDCSVQRRHQKLIEEAPSPAVDAALREKMGAVSVAAAKAIGYEGAGTLEFLLDRDGGFHFMEMNTRLQVEHPVTEAITGLDLVEWQLRVAAGEALPLTQDEIRFSGHAIEVRLCAEDVTQGFVPQGGTMQRWQAPASIRVEHALRSGATIPPYYDSMIAKLVAHGQSRDEARRRLTRGLADMVALGVVTNQEFLARCLSHPAFATGEATTAFITTHEATLLAADPATRRRGKALCAWLLHHPAGVMTRGAAAQLAHSLPVGLTFLLDGEAVAARVTQTATRDFVIEVDGEKHELSLAEAATDSMRIILDGVMETFPFVREGAMLHMCCGSGVYRAQDMTRAPAARAGDTTGDGRIKAAMNGRVVAVDVAAGDRADIGKSLLTLEAMKMEHVHAARIAGTVIAVHAVTGDQVAAGQVLIEIEPDMKEGSAA